MPVFNLNKRISQSSAVFICALLTLKDPNEFGSECSVGGANLFSGHSLIFTQQVVSTDLFFFQTVHMKAFY